MQEGMPVGAEAEAEVEAATKMQAVQRGKATRAERQEQSEAATKMQAVQRGKAARKVGGAAASAFPYGLCAFDVDGTLKRSDHTISPRVKAALAVVRARGAAVVIATGRPVAMAGSLALVRGMSHEICLPAAHPSELLRLDLRLHRGIVY